MRRATTRGMPSDFAIETRNLTKVYRSLLGRRVVRAVDGVSLSVERGLSFGFLGPNGAGKTTFVKMLLSATHPTAGSALLLNRPAQDPNARRSIGYLPENHHFPTYFTGAGMLDFYASLSGMDARSRKRRIPELLDWVGLTGWENVRLSKYSKGMLQRLGLAQALMHSPALLILDEPSDGVDPMGRIRIREILRSLEEQGTTIFINSHLLAEVESFCREVAILHRGRVVLRGSVQDLTAGRGYRLRATAPPERVLDELRRSASETVIQDGWVTLQFPTRDAANRAIDLLRRAGSEIECVTAASSTLEEVFVKTIGALG